MTDSPARDAEPYRPGACNIGPDEIRMRLWAGHLGLLATGILLIVLIVLDANPAWRLLIAIPATGAAVGYLQARLRFCAAFGLRGVFNFGSQARDARTVSDALARRRDRARAMQILGASIVIGIAVALLALAI